MTDITNDAAHTLLEVFKHSLDSFSVLAGDIDSTDLGKETTNLGIGNTPVFRFVFNSDSASDCKALMVGHDRTSLKIRVVNKSEDCILEFAESLDADAKIRHCGLMDLTDFISPIDSISDISTQANRVEVVRNLNGELIAIFIWFQHGFEIGFLIGYYNEPTVLFGSNVGSASEKASNLSVQGKLEVLRRNYTLNPKAEQNVLQTFDWFEDV